MSHPSLGVHFRKPSSQFYSVACGLRFGIQDLPVFPVGILESVTDLELQCTVCRYIYIYVHRDMCIYIYIHIHIYVSIYTYMYLYIHIYACIHIYIYTIILHYYITVHVLFGFRHPRPLKLRFNEAPAYESSQDRPPAMLAMLAMLMLDWFYWVHRDSDKWLMIFLIKPAK